MIAGLFCFSKTCIAEAVLHFVLIAKNPTTLFSLVKFRTPLHSSQSILASTLTKDIASKNQLN
jgi:hypothetical protein